MEQLSNNSPVNNPIPQEAQPIPSDTSATLEKTSKAAELIFEQELPEVHVKLVGILSDLGVEGDLPPETTDKVGQIFNPDAKSSEIKGNVKWVRADVSKEAKQYWQTKTNKLTEQAKVVETLKGLGFGEEDQYVSDHSKLVGTLKGLGLGEEDEYIPEAPIDYSEASKLTAKLPTENLINKLTNRTRLVEDKKGNLKVVNQITPFLAGRTSASAKAAINLLNKLEGLQKEGVETSDLFGKLEQNEWFKGVLKHHEDVSNKYNQIRPFEKTAMAPEIRKASGIKNTPTDVFNRMAVTLGSTEHFLRKANDEEFQENIGLMNLSLKQMASQDETLTDVLRASEEFESIISNLGGLEHLYQQSATNVDSKEVVPDAYSKLTPTQKEELVIAQDRLKQLLSQFSEVRPDVSGYVQINLEKLLKEVNRFLS